MNPRDFPGAGDPATWPACAGHPGDPRTEADDTALTADTAREIAEDEADRDAYSLAWWLNNHAVVHATGAVDLASVRERIELGEDCSAGDLLALAFNDADRAAYCLHLLRELYRAHGETQAWIKGRVRELLAAQAEQRAAEAAHYDRLAELHGVTA